MKGAGVRRYKLTGETGSYRYMAPVRLLALSRVLQEGYTMRSFGCMQGTTHYKRLLHQGIMHMVTVR